MSVLQFTELKQGIFGTKVTKGFISATDPSLKYKHNDPGNSSHKSSLSIPYFLKQLLTWAS
jgi:hypothetical protein